jgi:hypothetical protein
LVACANPGVAAAAIPKAATRANPLISPFPKLILLIFLFSALLDLNQPHQVVISRPTKESGILYLGHMR